MNKKNYEKTTHKKHASMKKNTTHTFAPLPSPNSACKGQGAFAHCGSLTSVDLTEVKELKSEAFQRCGSLRHVSLPNVTRRDSGFFQQKKRWMEKTDGNGWKWKTWASFFLFCVLTIWKFQRLLK